MKLHNKIKKIMIAFTITIMASKTFCASTDSMFFEKSSHPIIELLRQQYHQTIINMPMLARQNVITEQIPAIKESVPVISLQDTIADAYSKMKTDFTKALNAFQHINDYGETALQNIVDLLDLELIIVKHLMHGRTGASIERALERRNDRLKASTPSVLYMYDKIFDIAANDEYCNALLYKKNNQGAAVLHSLHSYDQKKFLLSIKEKLERYRAIIKQLQHAIAINDAVVFENR